MWDPAHGSVGFGAWDLGRARQRTGGSIRAMLAVSASLRASHTDQQVWEETGQGVLPMQNPAWYGLLPGMAS